ncbi:MAG: alkaline phosphatase family protein [Acidobacteria bacterium]|nr:alkaline phosphatase family protein [Acidobacteriota bacterium]
MKIKPLYSRLTLLVSFLLIFNLSFISSATPNNLQASSKGQVSNKENLKPKLAVVIVVDQFRADYLQRFNHLFGQKGFRRLMNQGAYFTNANYAYSNTYTAAGHATIVTGSLPSIHGIIGNKWFDRRTGKFLRASDDSEVKGVGTEGTSSPTLLLTTTIGDQLRLSNNYQSKSFGVSIKDRSAVFTAGRRGSGAYWFNEKKGQMCSSTYFIKELPEWVLKFNEQRVPDQYFQKNWERKLPENAYNISDQDDASYEDTWDGNTKTFPHIIDGNSKEITPAFYKQFGDSPFSNEMLAKFALATIDSEKLGQDQYPDFLTVSFSAPDLVGHMFGPYSQEVQDMIIRTDETIGFLLDELDKRFGLNNILVVLTADHGVAPIPAYAQKHNLGGLRIDGLKLRKEMEERLIKQFGRLNNDDKYIFGLVNQQFYLNEDALKNKKLEIKEVEDFLGQQAVKTEGFANYYTRTKIVAGEMPSTDIGRKIIAGFSAERSGSVFMLLKPFAQIAEAEDEYNGTGHGTAYHYDTHVPIIFMGKQIKPGIYHTTSSPSDIAPTLATILDVEPPNGSIGRVLLEGLK